MISRLVRFCVITLMLMPGLINAAPLPDPTRPADYFIETIVVEDLPEGLINWQVTAIRISPERRTAIVNNTLVAVGDEIGPARVLEIRPLSVVLEYERLQVIVKLVRQAIKKTVSVAKQ